jgi:hypothetical protein
MEIQVGSEQIIAKHPQSTLAFPEYSGKYKARINLYNVKMKYHHHYDRP